MARREAVPPPTLEQLEEVATKEGLHLSPQDLKAYLDAVRENLHKYEAFERLTEPSVEVRFPRTPGYRPPLDENRFNAWYWKTDVRGNKKGKLQGRKIAIKDNIFLAGVPLMSGSRLLEGFMPHEDATVVTRILEQGGHITGKANCEDMCLSGSSFTCATGPVPNPHDMTRCAGGSSSGCAVLVSQGEVDMAVGADQGGSIRGPASWCGIVGMKPTHGLIPYTGALSMGPILDHLGPMTKTVKDCAILLEVLAGYDCGLDARQPANLKVPDYTKLLSDDLSDLKVGILKEGLNTCEEDVVGMVYSAADKLVQCGAVVGKVSIPMHKDAYSIWLPLGAGGTYTTLLRNYGSNTGLKCRQSAECSEFIRTAMRSKKDHLSIPLKVNLLTQSFLEEHYGQKFQVKSVNMLHQLTAHYNSELDNYHVLLMPTLPYKARKLPPSNIEPREYVREVSGMFQNTAPFNATGHPAISINGGFSDNLPVGLQLVGKHWDDATVLRVAYAFERRRDLAGENNKEIQK